MEVEWTPERLREWERHVDALERATAELERRSKAMVEGMRFHYERDERT